MQSFTKLPQIRNVMFTQLIVLKRGQRKLTNLLISEDIHHAYPLPQDRSLILLVDCRCSDITFLEETECRHNISQFVKHLLLCRIRIWWAIFEKSIRSRKFPGKTHECTSI